MHDFTSKITDWYINSGRHDLPWQQEITPYRVWVSEIMLQQTQVVTVIPYFNTFIKRFPTIISLAMASIDDVLHLWSGLGYYSRARNLHKTARLIRDEFKGIFPKQIDDLMSLPGIGRTTAGAILALSMEKPYPILDGNVKRVLCRFHAIEKWPGEKHTEKQLWLLSESYTPVKDVAAYTQAIMDLGATICTRRQPLCGACPVSEECVARQRGIENELPTRKLKKSLPVKETIFAMIENKSGAFLLERRPPVGIWGGIVEFSGVADECRGLRMDRI